MLRLLIQHKYNMIYHIVLAISIVLTCHQPTPTVLNLNSTVYFEYQKQKSEKQYYQLQIPSPVDDALLVTAITQSKVYLQIFVDFGDSENPKYPTSSLNEIACYDMGINTCPIDMDLYSDKSIIYFTLMSEQKDYALVVTPSTLEQINPQQSYKLNFTDYAVASYFFKPQDFLDEVDIIVTYDPNFEAIQPFSIRGGKNKFPTSPTTQIQGSSLGSLKQIMRFMNISDSDTYYIFITAYDDVVLDFKLSYPQSQLQNKGVYFGQISTYLSEYQVSEYSYRRPFPKQILYEIHFLVSTLSGSGSVNVYYCEQEKPIFMYENDLGIPAHMFISIEDRQACRQIIEQKGEGLLFEEVIVKFENILPSLGYRLQFYFHKDLSESSRALMMEDKQFGLFPNIFNETSCISYKLLQAQEKAPLQLFYTSLNCVFEFSQCINETCTKQTLDNDGHLFKWTSIGNEYYVSVCGRQFLSNSSYFNPFILSYESGQTKIRIFPVGFLHHSIINMNQVQYYYIEPESSNGTFQITVQTINGYVNLYTSTTEKYPNLKTMEEGSDVQFWWEQQAEFSVQNSSQGIYIGVQGRSQSFYTIKVVISDESQSEREIRQEIEDGDNEINLSKNEVGILFYQAHIIPYNITVTPFPSCLYLYSSEQEMEAEKRCLFQMPTHLFSYEKLYIRIATNKTQTVNFHINVIIPELYLKEKPISLGCPNSCYRDIIINVHEQILVKYIGEGSVELYESDYSVQKDGQMIKAKCINKTDCEVTIKAIIPFGGMMFIENSVFDSEEVTWMSHISPISGGKNLLYPINEFSSDNNLVLFSQSASLDVYISTFSINTSSTNTIHYNYNSPSASPYSYQFQPFQTFKTISLKDLISCQNGFYCLATIKVEFDSRITPFVDNSVFQFSSNTYSYSIAPNSFYMIRALFGVSAFQSNSLGTFFATVKSFSNCDASIEGIGHWGQVAEDEEIQFEVQSTSNCVFGVSITECPYMSVFKGIQYHLGVENKLSVTYVHRQQKKFQILVSSSVRVEVNKPQNKCELTKTPAYQRSEGSNVTIEVNQTEPAIYVIELFGQNEKVDLLIMMEYTDLILLPNSYINGNVPAIMQYNTESDFKICIKVNNQSESSSTQIQLLISQYDKAYLSQKLTATKDSFSCLNVDNISVQEVQQYSIQLKGQNASITIYAEQQFQVTPLYPSVAYKSHISHREKQCYQTNSLIQTIVSILLTFQFPIIQEDFLIMNLNDPTITKLTENTFQIKTISNGDNTLCIKMVSDFSIDYYLTLEGNKVKSIVQNQVIYAGQNNYTVFQYIKPTINDILKNTPESSNQYLVKVVNCEGEGSKLIGSNNYGEVKNKIISTMQNYWSSDHTILSTMQILPGYYYYGIKSKNDSRYSVEIMPSSSLDLPSKNLQLANKQIRTDSSNEEYLVVELSPLSGMNNQTSFVYTLLLADFNILNEQMLQLWGKCPYLSSSMKSEVRKYEESGNPTFKIDINDDLPENISLFAFASIQLENANTNVSFFYNPTIMYEVIPPDDPGTNLLAWVILLAVVLIALMTVRYLYLLWKRRKNKEEIQFEMSESARQQNEVKEEKKQEESSKKDYGKFVEQVQ